MKRQLVHVLIFLFWGSRGSAIPLGDATSATATQMIYERIHIRKIADLKFGVASPGDPGKLVRPGESGAARFEVEGEPARPIQIILPEPNTVKMMALSKRGYGEIVIKNFLSLPERQGTIGDNGKLVLSVGAARGPIPVSQRPGEYAGTFIVTVVYQ